MDAEERHAVNSSSGDEGRKSLEHFRAKLKQLRPLSLGSLVGNTRPSASAAGLSSSSSISDVSASSTGLSLNAAAAVAAASSAALNGSAKKTSPGGPGWTQPGHPNPSVLNVSAQVIYIVVMSIGSVRKSLT